MTRTLATWSRLLLALFCVTVLQVVAAGAAHADPGLEVAKTSELDPAGETVAVDGSGFQSDITLFVVACDPAVENGGACDMANFVQAKTDADGAFDVDLKLVASFGTTDCLKVPCAVMTSKVGDGADRGQETTVPISFTGGVALPEESPSATESESSDTSEAPAATEEPEDSSSTPLVAGGVVLLALIAGAALYLRRNRGQA